MDRRVEAARAAGAGRPGRHQGRGALGTNIGIKRMVHAGDHGVTEAQLRRTRRNFISRDGLRRANAAVVNETLRDCDARWWGTGTACASDSKKFGFTRAINWVLITQQYDQMIKYVRALQLGTDRGRADPAPVHTKGH